MWRTFSYVVLSPLLWFSLDLLLLVRPQDDQSGFISIDCGGTHISKYKEVDSGLTFTPDKDFIDTGESKVISSEYRNKFQQPYESLRSFPNGARNCYSVNLTSHSKYLIRAGFYYGNFDGQNKLPEFELHLGPILWETVKLDDASTLKTYELIHVPLREYVHVCVVNTGSGVPFISALEIRPFPNATFEVLLANKQSLASICRFDTGQTAPLRGYRYPFDKLDRFWEASIDNIDWTQLNATTNVDTSTTSYQAPVIVMNTAATPKTEDGSFVNIWQPNSDNDENALYYIILHFAEVVNLQPNQSRVFNVTMGAGTITVTPTSSIYFYNPNPLAPSQINVSIIKTEESTLPPILNAYEVYMIKNLSGPETDQKDYAAITTIRSSYKIERNWQGDPCTPTNYSWNGVNCSTQGDDESPRIIHLNLAGSELRGQIDPSISNLTVIETLDLSNNNLTGQIPTFLSQLPNLKHMDLSRNNLTGQIPDIFSKLPNLTFLNLEQNNLDGSIPEVLLQRKNDGLLSLSFCENPNLLGAASCTNKKKKKKSFLLILAISIAGVSILGIISGAIWWSFKRKRKHVVVLGDSRRSFKDTAQQLNTLEPSKRKFTYQEIINMTNNFQTTIGKGGSGIVYDGHFGNKRVAAKKLSTVHGFEHFHAEVDLLLKVYHKNLTTLVGYCNDETNLVLVYEYMANGNLLEYLSENSSQIFSWECRLKIASDAAQGLEYLHNSIKPPIIHRDVKSENILLDENFQAKVSDFGVSKNFSTDTATHITTAIIGTHGYLDPEYCKSSRLNKSSDVYSFGIVLLEIITGRPAVVLSQRDDKTIHITQWVGFMLNEGNIHSIVDPRLEGDFNINSAWKALEIAMACSSSDINNRPNMSSVVAELNECLAAQMGEGKHNADEMLDNSMTILRPSVR